MRLESIRFKVNRNDGDEAREERTHGMPIPCRDLVRKKRIKILATLAAR